MPLSRGLLALAAALLAALSATQAKTLPSYFKLCERDSPEFSECIVQSVNALRPYLEKGIRSFKIPPLNPLMLQEVSIDEGSGPVSINLQLKNLRVEGGQNYKVNSVRPELEKYRINFNIDLPVLEMNGDYQMEGRALVLPIRGKGKANITVFDISPNATLIGKPVMRDGIKYMELEDFPVLIGPARLVKLNFGNLFGGNKQLGDNMNRFLNDNWNVVMEELRPIIENVVSAFLISASKGIFHSVPFDSLFPERVAEAVTEA